MLQKTGKKRLSNCVHLSDRCARRAAAALSVSWARFPRGSVIIVSAPQSSRQCEFVNWTSESLTFTWTAPQMPPSSVTPGTPRISVKGTGDGNIRKTSQNTATATGLTPGSRYTFDVWTSVDIRGSAIFYVACVNSTGMLRYGVLLTFTWPWPFLTTHIKLALTLWLWESRSRDFVSAFILLHLRPSWCVRRKNCIVFKYTSRVWMHLLRILRSRDRWCHVTLNGQGRDPEILESQYLGNRAKYRYQWATYRKETTHSGSRDWLRHVTINGQGHDPKIFEASKYIANCARYRVGVNGPYIGNHPLRVL